MTSELAILLITPILDSQTPLGTNNGESSNIDAALMKLIVGYIVVPIFLSLLINKPYLNTNSNREGQITYVIAALNPLIEVD